jgi:hypothetical protein
MLTLLHTTADASPLLQLIAREGSRSELRGRRCRFYAITCYIDFPALPELARSVANALKRVGATLESFSVFYDVREWAKQRSPIDVQMRGELQKILRLPAGAVAVDCVSFTNRLMHSKAYGVIAENGRPHRKHSGFVVTTSGNLTQRGLGLDPNSNVELVHVSRNPEDVSSLITIASGLRGNVLSPRQRLKQDEFLFAIRLLSAGASITSGPGT